MGYEAGLIINECLDSEGKVFAELKESVAGKTWNTPRGMLRINSFNESQVEEFKVRSFNFNEVKYHNHVIESTDSSFTESLQEEMKDVPVHGWLNPYLCT